MATRTTVAALWRAACLHHAAHSDDPIGGCPRPECQAALTEAARAVPRRPLAFGATIWGPLPGTAGMHILWPGPGAGLDACPADPSEPGTVVMRIRHPSANGIYHTPAQASAAAEAFITAGLGSGLMDDEEQ